ncbi:MAG TPA: hypothetical protein DEA43_00795 [Candidatus Moranbacteria bacterium]|nr:hypothetical protein [Candidatus Moranbacteria bacterium]HBT45407.1 hypothetical protein [Candidatus Moranbacteria bacterium]
MEKHFLPQKYPDLAGSQPVERAVDKNLRENKKLPKEERERGPETKQDRVDAYIKRIEKIIDNDRGFELLKQKILNRFTLNIENPETLERIANGLYESEKRIAIERGQAGDIQKLGSTQEIIEHYKPLVREKAEIQEKTLSSWLDYLKKNDAQHPMWFRYFVMRNIEKMGMLDKENVEYSKRAKMTVAPFPELNSEALGWVFKKLSGETEENLEEEKQKTLEKLINAKDFSKLYAFALVETAGKLNRETIEGEWKKYDQGSDWHILENELKGKGTGWCTAEGSAKQHLEGGDFYVYFSKGSNGAYSEPRVAIRMYGDSVGEVRGVNHRQELEPELVDIAQEKYHILPGGETYDKKAQDMKLLTKLTKKQEKGEQFSKEDLIFLYEIENKIEGFGYDKDPRVEQLRKQRIVTEDAPIVFECEPNQIATKKEEISENTKAYIGSLFEGIFQKNIEHIYTSFPEGKLEKYQIEIGGKTKEQLEQEMKEQNIYVYDVAKDLMNSPDFVTSKNIENANLVRLTVKDLGFPNGATTDEIYQKAQDFGLELCPAEVGPQMRLQSEIKDGMIIAMKQIICDGDPDVFSLTSGDGRLKWDCAGPSDHWSGHSAFVFRLRKFEA